MAAGCDIAQRAKSPTGAAEIRILEFTVLGGAANAHEIS